MKFKYLPYKEETVKVRVMSMGTMIQTISQALIRTEKKDMEIRIVDCFMGEVDSYNGLEELLMQDFNIDWKVSVYAMECMHDNKANKDFLKIVMADNIEMMI